MSHPSFVFLNTTNAPSLSPEAARQMRGHVTKSNFAKRRQRIARTKAEAKNGSTTGLGNSDKRILRRNTRIETGGDKEASLLETSVTISSHNNAWPPLNLQGLVLLNCIHPPGNPSEAAWVGIIVSDPALIEASMAIGARYWSPQPFWQWRADMHSSKALDFIIQRITSRQIQTDGFLGAVLTMAIAERLVHANLAWNIHIDGLAQIIKERRTQGIKMPSWFYDLLVLDVINHIFDFPRIYHNKVIDALGDCDCRIISQVAEVSESLIRLRKSIDEYHTHRQNSEYLAQEIEQLLENLRYKVESLRKNQDNKFVYTTAQTIELIINLLWPPRSVNNHNYLADKLKETLGQLPIRPCPYMDLTSCQLIVGAIAAERGTSTRSWFVNKLTSAAREMQSRGWNQPFEVLEKGLKSDVHLTKWFRTLQGDF